MENEKKNKKEYKGKNNSKKISGKKKENNNNISAGKKENSGSAATERRRRRRKKSSSNSNSNNNAAEKNRNAGSANTNTNKNAPSRRTPKNAVHVSKENNNSGGGEHKGGNQVRIIPLGGLHEIGKNLTVFEYQDEMIIVDLGFAFPDADMLGIDFIIPDFSYLRKNSKKIKGVIFTHAHEDHIGGVPYFLKEFSAPLFATKLTIGLIKNKMMEHKINPVFREITPGKKVKLSKHFSVDVIKMTHSIPDSVAFAIHTPNGTIFHTGDFKLDDTPIDEKPMDYQEVAKIASKGITLLMSDSTGAASQGSTKSESYLKKIMDDVFEKSKGHRIIVATFASNIHRIQTVIEKAIKYKRKISFSGYSIDKVMNTARELGFVKTPLKHFVNLKEAHKVPDKDLVIVTTGSQGEPMAALTRIASGNHKYIQVKKGDTIVLSSSPIPGNEKAISSVVDLLFSKGANVLYSDIADIHVSGHAKSDDLKTMLKLIKPKYFMPVHGEYRHLYAHAKIAESIGIPEKNIFIMNNGDILNMVPDRVYKNPKSLVYEPVFVDGLGVGDVGSVVLNDRKMMADSGIIIVSSIVDFQNSRTVGDFELISRGLIFIKENFDVHDEIKDIAKKKLKECLNRKMKDKNAVIANVKQAVSAFVRRKLNRTPIILVTLLEE